MMQEFSYKAYDRNGAVQQGELIASTLETARLKLKDQGMIVVLLQPVAETESTTQRLALFAGLRKPRLADIEFWSSQMALLLHNGVRVDRALDTARNVVANQQLRKATDQIRENVRSGMSLAQALGKHPTIFDALFVSVVGIGETSGRLAEAFTELAAGLGFRKEMKARTKQAMIYPLVVFGVCIMSIVFIFNFIVPRFETLFGRMSDPPLATVILLHTARMFTQYQWFALVIACLLPFGWGRLSHFPGLRRLLDRAILHLPITRNLAYTAENLRFASAMALMLNNGVLLVEALGYAVATIGNSHIRPSLIAVKESVKQGTKFSDAMAKSGFLPIAYEGIIEVGEQAGRMGAVFKDMESRMRTTYEQRLTNLVTFIEPLMIIVMGIVVGSIVVIMLMSTISIYDIGF